MLRRLLKKIVEETQTVNKGSPLKEIPARFSAMVENVTITTSSVPAGLFERAMLNI